MGGDGGEEGSCINNPYTCDIIGAFIKDDEDNNICVGWNYIDSSGITQTTIPVQGFYDYPGIDDQTENYCLPGDTPTFYIFDSTTYEIYLLASS